MMGLTAILMMLTATFIGDRASAQPSEGAATPAALVHRFYATHIHSLSGGLPSDQELLLLKPVLSARLHALFKATLDYQAQWIERHPVEPSPTGGPPIIYKPPFANGGFFQGPQDGSSRFEIARTVQEKDRWTVSVRSLPQHNMSPWRVTVVVVFEDHFAIDDLLYESAEDGSPRGSLTEYLSYRDED